ncbi:MAG: hypothetical protein IT436_13130 [Phycisphaerales bacterium]|nr:hypothetical protein [Phycisphaerales bacterium]
MRPTAPHPRLAAAVCTALALTLATLASPQIQPPSQPAQSTPPTPALPPDASPAQLLAILNDLATPSATRDRAADRLLAAAQQREPLDLLRVHLATAGPGSPGCTSLFRAATRCTRPPAGLFEPFTAILSRASPDQLPSMLPALASWRTRDSLRLLIAYADPAQPAPVRDSAFQALARLTGRDDLGPDLTRWTDYADHAYSLSDIEWTSSLLSAIAARADTLAARESAALARVTDSLRRLYLTTAPEQRSALLANLLLDDADQIRALGFELASRELSSTHRLDQPVTDACLKLLNHPTPRVRQNAALLLYQLSPPEAGNDIASALARETDPDAAAALLAACGRWPTPDITPEVIRWLARPDTASITRAPAAQAALALARAGHLFDPQPRDKVLIAIRSLPPEDLPAAAGPLLVILGNDDDRRAAAPLLRSPSAALRIATADAAVVYPELLPDLLDAASADPQLWDAAVRAVTMHQATAPSFISLTTLPAPSPDARREGLRFLASVMPALQILDAADRLPLDDPSRELVLTPLLDPTRRMSLNPEAPSYEATVRGLLMLARTRLADHRPDEALLALDATPDPLDPADTASLLRLRTCTLLALNRAEQALALDSTADDWLDALDPLAADPSAPGLLDAFTTKFRSLTPAQQERLDAIRARAPAADQERQPDEPPPS